MLIPDVILLVIVLALAAWRMLAPTWHPRLRIVSIDVALLLAAAQWALYDYTWQNPTRRTRPIAAA